MKTYIHMLFWTVTLILLSAIFTPYYSSFSESFYFVSMLLPVVFGTCYFFNFYLVPRFLLAKKYFKFFLYSFYMLIISLYLEMIVIMVSLIVLAKYSYNNMSPVSSDVFVLTITLYFIVLLFSFILLIKRSFAKEEAIVSLENEKAKNQTEYLSIRSERKMKQVPFNEILYIESLADYVKIYRHDNEVDITKEKISKLEEKLPDYFIRIHRSFIVHKEKVTAFKRETLNLGEISLTISRTYRETAWDKLTKST